MPGGQLPVLRHATASSLMLVAASCAARRPVIIDNQTALTPREEVA